MQTWTVAYCKPRQEKALGWDLCRRDVSYFLPMVMRQTSSGGRRRRNLYPLFPSYLFLAGDESERMSALRTDRIVKLIEVSEAEQSRLQREIAYIETALRNQPESLELYPRLVPGNWVRIKSGPMKDVEGVVVAGSQQAETAAGCERAGRRRDGRDSCRPGRVELTPIESHQTSLLGCEDANVSRRFVLDS